MSLSKFVAPEVVFGCGARNLAGRYARNLGAAKVLLVTDPGVVAAGWAAEVRSCIESEGIRTVTFSTVSQNPRAHEMMEGAALYAAEGCDVIVVVGGGSPIDCAKGIGIVVAHGRDILEFEGVDKVRLPSPPLICLPTTAGSSADVSQFVIVADSKAHTKKAIISKAVVPDVALVDPETTLTMDAYVTACSGIDALCHGMEAFVSTAHSPIVDLLALDAVRGIHEHLEQALRQPHDLDTRERLMLASLKAGMAFSNTSLGGVHATAHAVGGLTDLPHGECVALMMPHVVACNYDAAADRFDALAGAMGLEVNNLDRPARRAAIVGRLLDLCAAIGLSGRLGERGVTAADLPSLAQAATRDACIVTNPRPLNAFDLEAIYGSAL